MPIESVSGNGHLGRGFSSRSLSTMCADAGAPPGRRGGFAQPTWARPVVEAALSAVRQDCGHDNDHRQKNSAFAARSSGSGHQHDGRRRARERAPKPSIVAVYQPISGSGGYVLYSNGMLNAQLGAPFFGDARKSGLNNFSAMAQTYGGTG